MAKKVVYDPETVIGKGGGIRGEAILTVKEDGAVIILTPKPRDGQKIRIHWLGEAVKVDTGNRVVTIEPGEDVTFTALVIPLEGQEPVVIWNVVWHKP